VDGARLWGEQYQLKLTDVMAVQGKIAERVSEKLRNALTSEQQQRLSKRYTQSAEAYQLYLKGRYYLGKYNEEGTKKALESFKQAIDLDPNYALAYVGLADTYYMFSNIYIPPMEAMPRSRGAAERALAIDGTLAEAHNALAVVKSFYEWEWVAAEQEFKRAIELNPSYATARHMYGLFLVCRGRPDEALAEFKRARELDPLSLSIAVTANLPYFFAPPSARRYDRAIEELHKIVALDPNFHPAYGLFGLVYGQKKMYEEAIAALTKATQLDNSPNMSAILGHAYALAGKKSEALKIFDQLHERSKQEHVSAMYVAQFYLGLGEREQAFAWLEKSYERRDEEIVLIKVDPRLDSLRSDPRFTDLLRRMNLAP
jgi:tetratricopeptide (TPR) repeat protein